VTTGPRLRPELLEAVEVVPHAWITLADGTRLGARLWLPLDARTRPVPAVLEYLPYRKGEGTATGDHLQMTYLAAHGLAAVRVDMRGTGDSDGILLDEYLAQEQDDAEEVIAWIAAQPWCDGAVGMTGGSWGGFNSLQVAARRPPALRAIMSFFASDDRYADDVHYRGGCVIGMDMLQWATCMLAFNAKPPDPAIVGDGWMERWLDRLERTPPYIEAWLSHQRRDAYWQHGSVCEDYAAITCPVYAVGGWTDGYSDAVPRLLEHLNVPRRGLIGPWGHVDPVSGTPGPPAPIYQEMVRWFRHHLCGDDNGVMDGPTLRVFVQEWTVPAARVATRPGRWLGLASWPDPAISRRTFVLGDGSLGAAIIGRSEHVLRGVQACGLDSGAWCADGHSDDLPPDQRGEDGRSLCFDSRPLPAPLELVGTAEAVLTLASDRPQALVCVRLCEVAPDGASLLVTRGQLNLTHRSSHAEPEPLEPGQRSTVRIPLDAIAYRFAAGSRLRVAVSPTYWPLAWPSPEPVTLTLVADGSSLIELPVREPSAEDVDGALPGEPETPPPLESETLRAGVGRRVVTHDLSQRRSELLFDWDLGGLFRLPGGIESEDTARACYSVIDDDPLSARVECEGSATIARGDWRTRVEATGTMTSTATHFHVTTALDAYLGEARVWARAWSFAFERDNV
jgi:putative CocE/NonD family hydrolase